jgi:hypothetical protein
MQLMFSLTEKQLVPQWTQIDTFSSKQSHQSNLQLIDGEFLKPFEEGLRSRGFLSASEGVGEYPLWFYYEQGRNQALWQSGRSLSDLPTTFIWMNPLTLIEHIIEQGEETLSLLGSTSTGSSLQIQKHTTTRGENVSERTTYLRLLSEALEQSLPHLHALSVVGAELQASLSSPEFNEMTLDSFVRQ